MIARYLHVFPKVSIESDFFVSECLSCSVQSLSNGHSKTACIHWVVCWSENRLFWTSFFFSMSTLHFVWQTTQNLMQLYKPVRSWTVHTSRRAPQSKAFTTTKTWDAWKQIPKKTALSKTKTVNPETKLQHKIKIGQIPWIWETNLLNTGVTVTKKTMDDEIYEARIWKPNFAKITSLSSQKRIPAESWFLKKQSLLFTKAVLGFNWNHASKGRNQRSTKLTKWVLKLNSCRDRFLSRWGVGFGDLSSGDAWKFETNYFKKYH